MKTAGSKSLLIQADTASTIMGTAATPSQQVYSPYGVSKPNSVESLLGFTGALYDAAFRTYSLGNGHRVYSPLLMRFYQPDSFSPFHYGGLNCYVYCQDDPINFTDPTGRFKMPRRPMAQARTNGVPKNSFRASQGFTTQRPRRVQQRAEQRQQQRAQRPQDRPQREPQDNHQAPQPHQAPEMNLAQLMQMMDQAVLQAQNIGLQAVITQQIHPAELTLGGMTLAMSGASILETVVTWMTTGTIRNPMDTTSAMANYSPGYSLQRPPVG
ncbi:MULTISPECIES: RHS repeat-associated core domain-containing protein [Pseudomonas]|nr:MULTISPECIES: RHS repeat-associated core domain-containing protein [Pseudomonas]KAF4560290.1 RHS repeat-associated core domain-containing protein [Pseudomonas sp. CES]WJM51351.1 RHS repeat-associated core domain-containing protein [Pseudomonas asiatica]